MDKDTLHLVENSYYLKDKDNVFYFSKFLVDALPNDFNVFGKFYAKSNNNIYFCGRKIKDIHPASFEYLGGYYSKDIDKILYKEKPIKCDPGTFSVFKDVICAKDKDFVYEYGEVLDHVDPKNFESFYKEKEYTKGEFYRVIIF
jgi:hypothetical protein